ncbi:hypothetical protein [Rhizobium sp. CF080]|uniref:hypothetical protein n=1 Tax=Rhizobium sp. (strain CF080) TaxID=1144310 RepID=UPI0012DF41CB|nr:hypothetical protein [Rhizobium sp. CF080]
MSAAISSNIRRKQDVRVFTRDILNQRAQRDARSTRQLVRRALDPSSVLGQDVVKLIINAYRTGKTSQEELFAACDDFVSQCESHVQLGASAIETAEYSASDRQALEAAPGQG